MTEVNVSMNVRPANSDTKVIEIHGEVTGFAEDILMEAYTQASIGQVNNVIINFDDLDYMNSSGIGLLVTLLIRAQRKNQQVMAVGLNEHYQQIFQLTRLDEAIGMYKTEADALASVAIS